MPKVWRGNHDGKPCGCGGRAAEDPRARGAGEGVDATSGGDRYRGPDEPSTVLHEATANLPQQRNKQLGMRRRFGRYDRKHMRSTPLRRARPSHHPNHRGPLVHLRSHQKPRRTTATAPAVCQPSLRTSLIGAAHARRTRVHHPPPVRATSPTFRPLSAGSSPCEKPQNRNCRGRTPSSRSSRHSSSVRPTRWSRRSARPARDWRNVSLCWRGEIWRSGCG